MTNAQLCPVIGVPVLLNAIMFGLFMAYLNAKFEGVYQRFDVLDARLKHLEEAHE